MFKANPVVTYNRFFNSKHGGDDFLVATSISEFTREDFREGLESFQAVTFDYPDLPCTILNSTFFSMRPSRIAREEGQLSLRAIHHKPERVFVKMLYKRREQTDEVFYQKVCAAIVYFFWDEAIKKDLIKLKLLLEAYFRKKLIPFIYLPTENIYSRMGFKAFEASDGEFQGCGIKLVNHGLKTMPKPRRNTKGKNPNVKISADVAMAPRARRQKARAVTARKNPSTAIVPRINRSNVRGNRGSNQEIASLRADIARLKQMTVRANPLNGQITYGMPEKQHDDIIDMVLLPQYSKPGRPIPFRIDSLTVRQYAGTTYVQSMNNAIDSTSVYKSCIVATGIPDYPLFYSHDYYDFIYSASESGPYTRLQCNNLEMSVNIGAPLIASPYVSVVDTEDPKYRETNNTIVGMFLPMPLADATRGKLWAYGRMDKTMGSTAAWNVSNNCTFAITVYGYYYDGSTFTFVVDSGVIAIGGNAVLTEPVGTPNAVNSFVFLYQGGDPSVFDVLIFLPDDNQHSRARGQYFLQPEQASSWIASADLGESRVEATSILVSSHQDEYNNGGSILSGQILTGSEVWFPTWESRITEKAYKCVRPCMKKGTYNVFIPTANSLTWDDSPRPNLFWRSTSFPMILLNYSPQQSTDVSTMNIIMSVSYMYGQSINSEAIQGERLTSHSDLVTTLLSNLARAYFPSENPMHEKMASFVKRVTKFMANNPELKEALVAALKTAGMAGLKAIPSIAGLLI
jgi:hypothetical protein